MNHKTLYLIKITFVICAAVFTGVSSAAGAPRSDNSIPLFEVEQHSCYRIPSLAADMRGSVIAAAEHRFGTPERMANTLNTKNEKGLVRRCTDDGTINIVARVSADDGNTWGPITTVVKANDFLTDGYIIALAGNPTMVALGKPASYLMAFSVARSTKPNNSAACAAHRSSVPTACQNARTDVSMWYVKTQDGGKSWSKPEPIDYKNINKNLRPGPGHGVFSDGRIILPVLGGLILSDDNGATWRPGAQEPKPKNRVSTSESNIAKLANGEIFWTARIQKGYAIKGQTSSGGAYTRLSAVSKDNGETFDSWRVEERFPMPLVQSGMISYNQNRDVAVSFPLLTGAYEAKSNQDQYRKNLVIAAINDLDCGEPGKELSIFSGSAGYSDLANLKSGDIGVLMEAAQNNQWRNNKIGYITSIRWMSVSPAQLKPGRQMPSCTSKNP